MLSSLKPLKYLLLGAIIAALPLAGEGVADGRVHVQQIDPAAGMAYVQQVDRQTPIRPVRAAAPAPAAPASAAPAPSRNVAPPQATAGIVILELVMPEAESERFPNAHLDAP